MCRIVTEFLRAWETLKPVFSKDLDPFCRNFDSENLKKDTMFIRKSTAKNKNGTKRVYFQLAESIRVNGQPRNRVICSIGRAGDPKTEKKMEKLAKNLIQATEKYELFDLVDNLWNEKIESDALYDGFFVLTTNTRLSNVQVVNRYKDLWQVERCFRDLKSLHAIELKINNKEVKLRTELRAGASHIFKAIGMRPPQPILYSELGCVVKRL